MVLNKPPMGWNSWNTFGENIDEQLILEMADVLVSTGLADAGYKYLVIDDCWQSKQRDENERLVPDPKKFPHGMRYVADKVHEKGLKFGMYSCCGLKTCGGYPGSLDREWIDAQTFAEWGVDYLKYDYCYRPTTRSGAELYRAMGLALANCGRDIVFSACSWGFDETHQWIRTTGADLWRSTGDINDSFPSIREIIDKQTDIFPFGGKGCFNDMDMLVVGMGGEGNVGMGGCNELEYKTHFASWCMFGSPLMIGGDIRKFDQATLDLLKNPRLIEINQDEKCTQPYKVDAFWGGTVYARPMSNGDIIIGVFNVEDKDRPYMPMLTNLGIGATSGKTLELTDCFTGEITYPEDNVVRVELKEHDCAVLRGRIIDKK